MGILSLSATAAASTQLFQSRQQAPPPLLRGVFPATRGTGGGGEGAFSISTRIQFCFPLRRRRPLFFLVKSVQSSSIVDGLQNNSRVVPSYVLEAEKEDVKTVLTMFFKKEIGLSNEAVAATMSKSVPFIDHLVARLHSIHKTRYLVGRELTTLEIRDALIPYLENLCEEHEDSLDNVIENFRNPPDEKHGHHRDSLDVVVENFPKPPEEEQKRHVSEASPTKLPLDSKRLEAMALMTEIGSEGQLHPNTLYLLNIGLDLNQIKQMAFKYPPITHPGWGRRVRLLVEFLLDLGVPLSDIPHILHASPILCNYSLSENIIPSMAYLETLGLDKSKWAKVIYRHPRILACSQQKVKAIVDYLYELGLSRDKIGKVLTKHPGITSYSIDDKLRPTAEYFQSMGVNLTSLFSNFSQILSLSVESNLKPTTQFFLDKGFSIDDVRMIASRYGSIYGLSLTKNLIPKWDLFLTMDYPKSDLVKYPTYFGHSLEGRIKPRYAQMKECGVKLSLIQLLVPSDSGFQKMLNQKRMKKMLNA